MKRVEPSILKLWENVKKRNTPVIGVPQREETKYIQNFEIW